MADDNCSDEETWVELDDSPPVSFPCLFCDNTYHSASDILDHCQSDHGVDLLSISHRLKLDFYSWVKFINFIRSERPQPADLINVALINSPFPWLSDTYLTPVITDDPILQLDVENDDSDIGVIELEKLTVEHELEQYKTALNQAMKDLQQMRLAVQSIVNDHGERGMAVKNSEDGEEEEDGYFSSYSHFSIHEEMLKDKIRTEAYQLFIAKNAKQLFKDKVVLDVGCGTGILSLFAAKAGAFKVIAVDRSSIIHKAMDIARENGLHDKIKFIKGCIEEIELPVDKVDIIISEWMGYCLLYESMLDSVLYARDKWLKDSQHVYPNKVSLSLMAASYQHEYETKIHFWDKVYGFHMTCMKEEVLHEAALAVVHEDSLISSPDVIKLFDLSSVEVSDLDFESSFSLKIKKQTICHALVAYFDVQFSLDGHLSQFTTSPIDEPTHWKQTVLNLRDPLSVNIGDLINGKIKFQKNSHDYRSLDISLSLELVSPGLNDGVPVTRIQKLTLS